MERSSLASIDKILHEQTLFAAIRRPSGTQQHVHGTPITPYSKIAELTPTSFCMSYWNRHSIEPYLEKLHPEGIFLLDNGAFSVFMHNQKNPNNHVVPDETYWSGFYQWAETIMAREPRAHLIIPDIIDGSPQDNIRMIENVPGHIPADRTIPVWHLHEPIDYLLWLTQDFGHIAFGSSGQFKSPGTLPWRQRISEAMTAIHMNCLENPSLTHPRIHMLRGLGPMAQAEFSMQSADSTNLARNHALRQKAGLTIKNFQKSIEDKRYPPAPYARWPFRSTPTTTLPVLSPLQLQLL